MIRELNTNSAKAYPSNYTAATELTRGAFVTVDEKNGTVSAATGITDMLVDVEQTNDGINAIITPSDGAFEKIAAGTRVILHTALPGDRYATSELTPATMAVGAAMTVADGKAVAAGTTAGNYKWVYGGTYDDPTGIAMYIAVRRDVTVA
jgi:hypothetical protein